MSLLIRLAVSALAVWLSTIIVPGIDVTAKTTAGTIGTVVLVALIFGVVNAVLKPIIKFVGCAFYVVTLGLISVIVNGLLFLLTSWISSKLDIPFHVDTFWHAVLGALLVGIVSFILGLVFKDRSED
jgi:putative membrane protein